MARDYAMQDGRTIIPVRVALLFLFWRRLNLDRPDGLIERAVSQQARSFRGPPCYEQVA